MLHLLTFPQADRSRKLRPVLLLKMLTGHGDWLVCGISTQLRLRVPDFDELIDANDGDFLASGLKQSSIARLSFVATVPATSIVGVIGQMDSDRHQRVLKRFASWLSIPSRSG